MLYVGDSESSHVHDISVASGLMARFRVPPPIAFTLDEILLRTDSKEFNFWSDKHLASASAALEQKPLGKRKGAGAGAAHLPKWEAEHAAAFKKAGLEWPPVISPSPSNAFTATLPQRSMECLLLDEWRFPRTSFKQRIVSLGQSMRRNWGRDNCCPCVVPRGLFWERSRQSPVWGWELLMLQGLEAAMCPAAHDFSNAALVDLAGSTGELLPLPAHHPPNSLRPQERTRGDPNRYPSSTFPAPPPLPNFPGNAFCAAAAIPWTLTIFSLHTWPAASVGANITDSYEEQQSAQSISAPSEVVPPRPVRLRLKRKTPCQAGHEGRPGVRRKCAAQGS